MTIRLIIATDQESGIGKNNKIPWDCPEDLQYFKGQTEGGIVVMGHKTYKSLPFENGLPDRTNYVLSNSLNFPDNIYKVCQLRCVSDMKRYCLHTTPLDVWVIGGASIYKQLLPYVEEIHHTIVDGVYDCDTFFDMNFLEDWDHFANVDLADNAVLNIWRKDG